MKIYAVGGAIRDALLGHPSVDMDYVVVGATPEEMVAANFRPVGNDFPVFLHPKTQAEYALARTERKNGVGYKGFDFQASPDVTLEQDLARRDLTINAMAREVDDAGQLFGPVIDPYGGQQDLELKLFRHVSEAFIEDPLRVLRVARFAARFHEFTVAPETQQLLSHMVELGELKHLVAERVWQELSRGLMSKEPSRMLAVLKDCGAIQDIFPADLLVQEWFDLSCRDIDLAAVAQLSLPVRYAALLSHVDFEQFQAWAERFRIPLECRSYAEVFRIWRHHYLSIVTDITPKVMMVWFDRADAWRKPARITELLDLADILGIPTQIWRRALTAVQDVNPGNIAQSLDNKTGEAIKLAVHAARLKAVEACL